MLTREQLQQFGQGFQIDTFTIFREYLQLIFLNTLYQEKAVEKIWFKGGTCLRLLYSSPRFSEDLDFSTQLSKKTIDILLKKATAVMQKDVAGVTVHFLWHGKNSIRYRLNYQGEEFKYPLSIRLDFSFESPLLQTDVSPLRSDLPTPLFSLVMHLKIEEIFAEKVRAFLTRAKGRDIFDLWYLTGKEVTLDKECVAQKLKAVHRRYIAQTFLDKIENYPLRTLEMDLGRFLPQHLRKVVPVLQSKLLAALGQG